MKTFLALIGAFVIVGALYVIFARPASTPVPQSETVIQNSEEEENAAALRSTIEVMPIEHATAVITLNDTVIYTDPTGGAEAFRGQSAPNIVLVTDIHGDHLSTTTLSAVIGNAVLIVPQAVKDLLPNELAARSIVLANGAVTEQSGLSITAMPMYNLPETTEARHTKGRGNGYLIETNGDRLYVAGDTAGIPEMRSLTDIDVALVPMNLPFTMSVDEAADAVLDFAPRTVYPYHYRGQDGLADVERFRDLVKAGNDDINVVLLNWYPSGEAS